MSTKTYGYRAKAATCAKQAHPASNGAMKEAACMRVHPAAPVDITSASMVRVIVKLRPEQYDQLFHHVREVGSTISAFCRESAVKAMREEHPDTAPSPAERQGF
jgi:hypothetical protein